MANAARGEGSITVEGRAYTLAFDVNAMCEVEYLLDSSTDRILKMLMIAPPFHVIRALLWGGLRRHHEDIDLRQAGDLIEAMGGAGVALDGIGRALQAAFPDSPEGGESGPPQTGAAAGTGRRSSNRGSRSSKTPKPSGA